MENPKISRNRREKVACRPLTNWSWSKQVKPAPLNKHARMANFLIKHSYHGVGASCEEDKRPNTRPRTLILVTIGSLALSFLKLFFSINLRPISSDLDRRHWARAIRDNLIFRRSDDASGRSLVDFDPRPRECN